MNKKLLYCAAFAATLLSTTQTNAQIDTDMIGYYSFNGDAKDVLGSGRDGSLLGSVTMAEDRDGNANSAYHLDGSSRINIAHDAAFADMNSAFSISMWIRPTDLAAQYHVLISKLNNNTRELVWREQTNGLMAAHYNSGGSLKFCTSPVAITANEWQHVVLVWTGTDMIQYRNGVQEMICDHAGNNITFAGGDWSIGSLGGGETFIGDVDEVRLWSRAITPSEVIESAEMDKVRYSDMVLDYPFNGSAMDHSVNTNDAVVSGATLVQDRFGNDDAAYYFDGVDDYIEIPHDDSYKIQLPITISCWLWMEDSAQSSARIFTTDNHESLYYGTALTGGHAGINNLGAISAGWGNGLGAGSQHRRSVIGSTVLNNNKWQHVVLVMRGVTDMDIYVDGVESGESYSGTASQIIAYSTEPGRLGAFDRSGGGDTEFFKGAIDDFKMWGAELTASDVDQLNITGTNNTVITGINPFKIQVSESVALYPNPAKNNINIVGDYNTNASYNIASIDGMSHVNGLIGNGTIDIQTLDAGLYVVEIVDGGKVTQSKFMKE